jgi:hypothetical protein
MTLGVDEGLEARDFAPASLHADHESHADRPNPVLEVSIRQHSRTKALIKGRFDPCFNQFHLYFSSVNKRE